MKDKTARVLAVIALVFMGIFLGALIAALVDYTLMNNGIGYLALASGIVTVLIFVVLKFDGRGYSVTKMNNEIEMEKIKRENEQQIEREKLEQGETSMGDTEDGSSEVADSAHISEVSQENKESVE